MQNPQSQQENISQGGQSFEQRDRVKQGGLDIEQDNEHQEGSTMNTLSVENLSSSNIDHDAAETLHKGWEKATDTIAQGVEVVKRIIMHELPPVEGETLKDKALNLKDTVSEKVQEVKEKAQEQIESGNQGSEGIGSKISEAGSQLKQQGQEVPRKSRTSDQTDLYRSNSGSTPQWQPTQQMKDVAREKLGEYKEKYNVQSEGSGKGAPRGEEYSSQSNYQSQQESFGSGLQQDSTIKIEHGKEVELGSASNSKIQEVESLSQQLSQKVEELKRTAAIPTDGNTETIIIIQQGGEGLGSQQQSQSESQHSGSQQNFGGNQGQEQQRPKLGQRSEQQWRNQEGQSQGGFAEKISEKAQELKEGFKQGYDKGFEKAGSHSGEHHESEHHLTTESQSFKPSAESRSLLTHELQGDQQVQQGVQGGSHHEGSEHHLNANAQSFKPSSQGKSLLKELGSGSQEGQRDQGVQGNLGENLKGKLNQAAEQIKEKVLPSGQQSEGKSLKDQISDKINEITDKIMPLDEAEKAYGQSQDQGQGSQSQAPPAEMKETITYHPRDIRGYEIEYVPKHEGEEAEGHSQSHGDQGSQGQTTPAEMKETITYHPRDIRGYEIEYVPKHEGEGHEGHVGHEEHESQRNNDQEAKPAEERIPFLDRVQHGLENASQTYHSIRDFFTSKTNEQSQGGQGSGSEQKQSRSRSGSQAEQNTQVSAPPAEMKETITYHPRDIKGYEIEYVPKHHNEGQGSETQEEEQGSQNQGATAEIKENFTYHPRDVPGYEVEYVPKHGGEGEHNEGQESEQKPASDRVPLMERVQHGLGAVRGFFHHDQGQGQQGEASAPAQNLQSKAQEGASELSSILESQAEVLKTKYSALRDDQPHGEELLKGESNQKSQEGQGGQEGQERKGLFGRVSGALHSITDRFGGHGGSNLEGKIEGAKEEVQQKVESPREKIYEFNPKAKKAEEKGAEAEQQPGLISRISGGISQGIEGVKGRFQSGKEESGEETSTEKNQSVFEKLQGKIQGKQTGEEVDKQGFRKVHDGFSESVDELKKEQNEQFHEQIVAANENPFEPLRTKQAALIDHPVTSSELVGGNLKEMTANFDENAQEMISEEKDEEKKGLFQKMKQGLFSKLGRGGDKENEETA